MSDVPGWVGRYIGIPFKDDGLDLRGCHCFGLVRLVLRERAGIDLPSYSETDANDLLAAAKHFRAGAGSDDWRKVETGFRAFDCVLMTAMTGTTRVVGHVGVLISPSRVLHVWEKTDSIHMPLDHPRLQQRVVGIYRHRELDV